MSSVFQDKIIIADNAVFHQTNPQEFRKVVENRRSVRLYENTPVPESVMKDIFDLTLLAPNSSNLQPWEFYWVRSKEKKEKLIQFCMSQNAAKTAPELVVAIARIDKIGKTRKQMLEVMAASGLPIPKAVRDYYEKIVPIAYSTGPFSILAPLKWLVFNLVGIFQVLPREPLGKPGLKLWAAKSTALACENFMLAASAHGFDTCPMEGLDSKRVKKLLGLPRSAVVVMAISVGKRKKEGVYGPRIRFPREQFIFEI